MNPLEGRRKSLFIGSVILLGTWITAWVGASSQEVRYLLLAFLILDALFALAMKANPLGVMWADIYTWAAISGLFAALGILGTGPVRLGPAFTALAVFSIFVLVATFATGVAVTVRNWQAAREQ